MSERKDESKVVDIPKKKNKHTATKTVFLILLILVLLAAVVFGGTMIYLKTVGINDYDKNDNNNIEENTDDSVLYDDIIEDDKHTYQDIVASLRDDSDLSTQLYNWYSNGGEHMSSPNVINILIVGVDASTGSIKQGNSDVMMMASVNKQTKCITLCSFLRDSYTYFESSRGNGYYSKLNAAYSYGGIECLKNAIENNYKIAVDYFVAVDFDAFEKVIDAIGGVTLDVEKFEAEGIENYAKIKDVPYGKNVTLNGQQALLYCRMRKIYVSGDVQRTENQRKVINAIIKKTKSLDVGDLNNVIQTLGPYVYTDCSSTKIVSLGTTALVNGWYNYKVYSMVSPPESARTDYKGNLWMWLVNYPVSAQYVQKQLYGKTNIVLK